jgi:hypothetical protein
MVALGVCMKAALLLLIAAGRKGHVISPHGDDVRTFSSAVRKAGTIDGQACIAINLRGH